MSADAPGEEDGGRDEERIRDLFLEFLEALERGRDAERELVERAGRLGPRLAERIRVHRELAALSQELGLAPARPRVIGRFEVRGLLGAGGISRVYEAHDPRLGRAVALKVLDRKGLLDRADRAWALNEARSLARITHRNVARVYDVGEVGEDAYIAMELLPGPSLEDVIREWRRRNGGGDAGSAPADARTAALAARYAPWSARIGLLEALAGALAHCHDHGILHRDIKPANVLFDADGEPRLIDFGLAHVEGADDDSRLGLTQALVGTAAYIAPEQVASDKTGADPRSDQFSLGTLGYEIFALENPFHRPSRHAILAAVEVADPPPLAARARGVPPDLARAIHHALALDPEARYPDLAAFAADLRAILAHRPISVAEPSLGHMARLWLRRHRRGVAVVATVVLVALGALAGVWGLETLATHRSVLAELDGLRPETFEDPGALDRAFQPLLELQRRARAFDADAVRSLFPLSARVERTVHDWSRRLSALLAADRERSAASRLPVQDMIYRRLIWQDEQLCPECPYNAVDRRRGRVGYPPDVLAGREYALERLGHVSLPPLSNPDPAALALPGPDPFDVDSLSAFHAVPFLDLLVPGTYRLIVWRPGARALERESVFYVTEGWPPLQEIRVVPPRAELVARSVDVERSRYDLMGGRGTAVVPAFRVLVDVVTVADFELYCSETDERPPEFPGDAQDAAAPAWVSLDGALGYAAWAGGRLPMRLELLTANASARITLPQPSETGGVGEYLLDHQPESLEGPTFLRYETHSAGVFPDRTRPHVTRTGARSVTAMVAFRIVFSTDEPALYRALAREPLER